jgi:hypothetical protein
MMKKLFLVLALLSLSGVAFAANIPVAVDPSAGPEIWTQEVFNDAGSALTSGSVVVWDYTDTDMSNIENRKMYVTTTTTADDIAVAGVVVDPSIANQDVGTIAIRGPVVTLSAANGGITAGTAVGTTTTAGKTAGYANTGADDGCLGFVVAATTNASLGGGSNLPIVFVEPSVAPD